MVEGQASVSVRALNWVCACFDAEISLVEALRGTG